MASTRPLVHGRYGLGWRPDTPDARDHLYAVAPGVGPLPAVVDLTPRLNPFVYDQGNLGSCTGNAIAGALWYENARQGLTAFLPSRLFIYFNERAIEGTIESDAGAELRDGIKSIAASGVCDEAVWPYTIPQFTKRPSQHAYDDASFHRAITYQRLSQTLYSLMTALANGHPFVVGISLYESFESEMVARTGHAPIPTRGERLLGGHAVLCAGYDTSAGLFRFRNSWSVQWGARGDFTLPFAYLLDPALSGDMWVIQRVVGIGPA